MYKLEPSDLARHYVIAATGPEGHRIWPGRTDWLFYYRAQAHQEALYRFSYHDDSPSVACSSRSWSG